MDHWSFREEFLDIKIEIKLTEGESAGERGTVLEKNEETRQSNVEQRSNESDSSGDDGIDIRKTLRESTYKECEEYE